MFGSKQDKIQKAIEKKKTDALIKFLGDKDKSIVLAAIQGLGTIKEDDSFNAVIPYLSSDDAQLRQAAAEALGEMGNAHAKAFLLHAASIEKDAKARAAMEHANGKLKEH